jgi:dihydrodipicolinate synthase/N-acetylneuraminate lyase
METIEITTEQIAQHYKAMGDSVTLINQLLDNPPEMMSDEEVADTIKRNVDHLEIMLAKDFWTDEDMSDVEAAIAAGK